MTSSFEGVFSPEAEGKSIAIPSSRGDQSVLVRAAVVVSLFLVLIVFPRLIGEFAAGVVFEAFGANGGSIDDRAALT